jgi:hypothetical protein
LGEAEGAREGEGETEALALDEGVRSAGEGVAEAVVEAEGQRDELALVLAQGDAEGVPPPLGGALGDTEGQGEGEGVRGDEREAEGEVEGVREAVPPASEEEPERLTDGEPLGVAQGVEEREGCEEEEAHDEIEGERLEHSEAVVHAHGEGEREGVVVSEAEAGGVAVPVPGAPPLGVAAAEGEAVALPSARVGLGERLCEGE